MVWFFFKDTATTEIYTLSLHDALPISTTASSRTLRPARTGRVTRARRQCARAGKRSSPPRRRRSRSEEHTSELQSRQYLVCRLLLEKKKIPLSLTWLKCPNHSPTIPLP